MPHKYKSILWGPRVIFSAGIKIPTPIKRREFDEIVFFSAGSEKSSVLLAYTIFQVLPKKQNIANYRRFNKIKAALCSAALCVVFYVLLICYTFAD